MDYIMDIETSKTITVAALGRPFNVGMLYDCRNDSLVPGVSLWDHDDIVQHIHERPQFYNDFEIVASESTEDKSSALNVDASLMASFMTGLVEVEGSAKYLKNQKTSKNQARVTLKYEATTKFQELSMNHLGRGNVKHPYVFEKGLATHVVTAVLYGAQAFFVFDREVSKDEDHQDIQGKLKLTIKKIPKLSIEGEGNLQMEEKETKSMEKFSCKYHGDFFLENNPISFQDAIQVYQSLPKLLDANKENVVPIKVWLLPLTCLHAGATQLVRQLSAPLIRKTQSLFEDFSELEMRSNDALKTTIAQQFPEVGKKLKTFKALCFDFKLEFQRDLAKKLPSIRGGGEQEDLLYMTLWDYDDLKNDIREGSQCYNNFDIVASESVEDTFSALNVEASLKASFLSGLVEVEGSAKYLNDCKTSKNLARVTLNYQATTKVQELSMNHIGRSNVKHPHVFDKGIATHVVTAILYGAQAFFVFDREVSDEESHQDIHSNMKVMIKKIPSLAIEGEGSLQMDDKDIERMNKLSCKFYGDFLLRKSPTTFQNAIQVYQSLPQLLGTNGENAVPIKVWLMPLVSLDSSADKPVRQISIRSVQEFQSVVEDFIKLEMRCNDAIRTTTAQQFPQIGEKLKTFAELCSEFKLDFQKIVAKQLISIRGGGEEEAVLAEILERRHSFPFNSKNLHEWMDCKEREICILKSYTKMMNNTKIVPSQNKLDEEILSAEHAVCFVFTSLGSDEPYLSALSNYLKETRKPDDPQDPYSHDIEREQWYASPEVSDAMRVKAKLFSDFAEANKDNKNVKFLTVGLTNETQQGSSIYVYKDVLSVSENFEPPSKPETVTAGNVTHNSVTLKISPPRFGEENIISYFAEYCVSGEDGWKQTKAAKAEDITVSGLTPNTEYMFRCRAVTSIGVGPAGEVSSLIKTLPCSPPGKPQVETNSSEITVSWEKPAEIGKGVHMLSYILEYIQTQKLQKDQGLQWNQMVSEGEKGIISGLQSATEYALRVRCDCGVAGRSKESISVNVCTTKLTRLAEILKTTDESIHSGSLSLYKLPLKEEDMHIDGCQRYNFGKESMMQNRTIMLLGATGSGKSTLINGMINYIVGVEWKDDFRFKLVDEDQLKSQAESQTSEVTVYKINHQDGFQIPFSLTIVDTPGFGDTSDIERDRMITEQLRNLFSATLGVSEIDAVCFVVPASLTQLTPSQKNVFDSVLSIFGKDVAENIRVLVTSADGQRPPVLEAINESGVPCPKTKDGLPAHFKFNNSALFADNKSSTAKTTDRDDKDACFDEMFWDMGTKSMKSFFVDLNVTDTKSLTMTKEVLRERKQLENSVENLQQQVKLGLAKLEELKKMAENLKEHEAGITRNENLDFEFTIKKHIQEEVSDTGKYITKCQQCQHTCLDKCPYTNDVGPACEVSSLIKTLPCSPPGTPQVETTSSGISISWEKPAEIGQDVHILSYIVEYAQTDKLVKDDDLQWNKVESRIEKVILSGLQSETAYAVRVRCDCGVAGRSKESISVNVCTTKFRPLTEILKHRSENIYSGSPSLYKLPLKEEDMDIDGCLRFDFGKESMKQNRTIMLFGATGSGKSTLINGMINYIVGVEWKDNFRFRLVDEHQSKSQAESQTSEVTVYKINHQDGFQTPFSLTIVDTPGFGDARGIERDRKVIEQLHNLFSAKLGITEIDAVCFVAQAALAQLTSSQKYMFDSMLSIFGKDVAENIRVLVTFADSKCPTVLEAINASGVPCPKTKDGLPAHFKFNNSALFADNKSSTAKTTDENDEDGCFDEMFWNMGTRNMKRFFVALNVIHTKSLTMTKEVLSERKQLENSVENLQKQVKLGLAKLEELKETSGKLKEHQAEISRNENFEFEFTVKKPVEVDISGSRNYITNCQQCHYTCHYPCAYADDAEKRHCSAMGSGGYCSQCPGKCHWSAHFNQKYRWDYKEVKEKRTVKELQGKYLKATEAKTPVQALIDKLKAEYDHVQAEVVKLMDKSGKCLNRLKEIALKPNPLSTPEYIDMLIEGEKTEAKPGWKERVRALMAMRENAEYLAKVDRGETLLQCP
ncbi:uncharacterized protein LOC122993437 [Scomber scombrus]|uniref:Uncharacterized protein LOC122993437 n=1 Tax=Scomber scombrus TaxID=13677 RepID=A0AAV1QCR7_SCOSC